VHRQISRAFNVKEVCSTPAPDFDHVYFVRSFIHGERSAQARFLRTRATLSSQLERNLGTACSLRIWKFTEGKDFFSQSILFRRKKNQQQLHYEYYSVSFDEWLTLPSLPPRTAEFWQHTVAAGINYRRTIDEPLNY
jgi:hypothetical protein